MEPSLLICGANRWTGLYMIGTSVMIELIVNSLRGDSVVLRQLNPIQQRGFLKLFLKCLKCFWPR